MRVIRRLAERLSHRFVFKRRLPARFGRVPMYVSTEGGLSYLRPQLADADPWLLSMALELVAPGAVVWDVGANLGLFSFACAALAGPKGRVLAIEPDAHLVETLRRSARLEASKRAPVEVLPVAISDQPDIAGFHIAKRARAANYLAGVGGSQTGGVREEQLVIAVTLDWLLERYPAPSVLKIDVEGAEVRVFEGARAVLSTVRPLILCEASNERSAPVLRTLKANGYTVFDAMVPRPERRPLEVPAYNIVAYPNTKK